MLAFRKTAELIIEFLIIILVAMLLASTVKGETNITNIMIPGEKPAADGYLRETNTLNLLIGQHWEWRFNRHVTDLAITKNTNPHIASARVLEENMFMLGGLEVGESVVVVEYTEHFVTIGPKKMKHIFFITVLNEGFCVLKAEPAIHPLLTALVPKRTKV